MATLDALTDEYNAWLDAHNLPPMSADELKIEFWDDLSESDHEWLDDFIQRWNNCEQSGGHKSRRYRVEGLNDEPFETTWEELRKANDPAMLVIIDAMEVSGYEYFGGGAAAEVKIERIA